ncbi:hypothetical protein V6N13_038339 [Hibiscus sabdariffa]
MTAWPPRWRQIGRETSTDCSQSSGQFGLAKQRRKQGVASTAGLGWMARVTEVSLRTKRRLTAAAVEGGRFNRGRRFKGVFRQRQRQRRRRRETRLVREKLFGQNPTGGGVAAGRVCGCFGLRFRVDAY